MKHFLTLLSHEVRMLLVSPSTYIVAMAFLAFMGFIFTGILEQYSKAPQELSPAIVFFQFFWFPVLFMVPLLTMKSLAEERRLGTIETLLTTPVTTTEVVLGKYAASYLLYLCFWGATVGLFYILHKFVGETRFLDLGPLIGGYVFIAVSGLFFIGIGIFASSLSRNQAVAGVLCFVMLVGVIVGTNYLADSAWFDRDLLTPVKEAADYMRVIAHRDDFTRGVVDTRQLLFYLSGTVLSLIFSILSVEAKLLHS
ncbi:MAG TPA: ABC transporter permease [Opitutus sp.]|nr:ABC transporter permease [Opitutus sp.]